MYSNSERQEYSAIEIADNCHYAAFVMSLKEDKVIYSNRKFREDYGEFQDLNKVLYSVFDYDTIDSILNIILAGESENYIYESTMPNVFGKTQNVVFTFNRKTIRNEIFIIVYLKSLGPVISQVVEAAAYNNSETRSLGALWGASSDLISVLIVDDNKLSAKMIEKSLERYENINVEGIVENGIEAMKFLKYKLVDVMFLDKSMPEMDGLETLKQLKDLRDMLKVIMISGDNAVEDVKIAFASGADAFLSKGCKNSDLINSIFCVQNGGKYICENSICNILQSAPNLAETQVIKISNGARQAETLIAGNIAIGNVELSKREQEIFDLAVKGKTNQQIADKLYISVRTVETHRRNILQKYGKRNFFDLILHNNNE
jgi:DNA-binding NarL/FixJ family response regulator